MEKQAFARERVPSQTFKATFWEAQHPYPLLPLAIDDGASLTEQKVINNLNAMMIREKRQSMEARDEMERLRREVAQANDRVRKQGNLITFLLCLFIVLALAVGLACRALRLTL